MEAALHVGRGQGQIQLAGGAKLDRQPSEELLNLLAQLPDPQPGWAQQYNYDMQPLLFAQGRWHSLMAKAVAGADVSVAMAGGTPLAQTSARGSSISSVFRIIRFLLFAP